MTSYEKYEKTTMPEMMANIDAPLVNAETVKKILLDIDEMLMRLNDELFDINNAVDNVNNVNDARNPNAKSSEASIIDTLRKIREEAGLAVRQAINIRERLW